MAKVYIFKNEYDFSQRHKFKIEKPFIRNYLLILHKVIIVPEGYAWDGCSPKKVVKDLVIGTPDGASGKNNKPKTYYASMVHDALYQYKSEVPVTRKQADKLFYDMLVEADFYWAKTYYRAVRMFGGLMGKWKIK